MTRPLLLLDVDGVLNPYNAKPHRRPAGYQTHRLRPTGWYDRSPLRVWLEPTHGIQLVTFAQEHDVELVWCTTWEHDANTMIGPAIGLPELPVIEFGYSPANIKGWKYPAVLAYAGDRPLAWLDDEFAHPQGTEARREFEDGRGELPTLLHKIDSRIGLTQLDLRAVGRWFDGLDREAA